MDSQTYDFKAKVWLYPGQAAWHFITVPKKLSAEIKDEHAHRKRGFGSLKVKATIGTTTWSTSIFPDNKIDSYLLPIKAEVRKKENLTDGTQAAVEIEIVA